MGLKPHLVLAGTAREVDGLDNLLLGQLVSESVTFVPFSSNLQEAMEAMQLRMQTQGARAYVIPVGGSCEPGVWGYIDAFAEVLAMDSVHGPFTDLVVACGSGGTAAALAVANKMAGAPYRIHAITVCNDKTYFHRHVDAMAAHLGVDVRGDALIRIVDGYKGAGYARSQPHELAFIRRVARGSGLFLDPVYTAKAALGLREELRVRAGLFSGRSVLFIHTGGLFGVSGAAMRASSET